MTEEQFNQAWDIIHERSAHQDKMEQAQKILDYGVEKVDINEILRISPFIRDGVYIHINELLKRFVETEKTCVELCNCRLEKL